MMPSFKRYLEAKSCLQDKDMLPLTMEARKNETLVRQLLFGC